MNFQEKKTIKILKEKYLNYNIGYLKNRPYVVFFNRHHSSNTLKQCLLAKAFNNEKKFNIIVVSDQANDITDEIYKVFNIKNFFYFDKYFKKKKFNFFFNINFLATTLATIFKIIFYRDYIEKFANDYQYKGINFGDLVYDDYIRQNHRYLQLSKIKFISAYFKNFYLIRQRLMFIESIYNRFNIKKTIISTKGFINCGCIALRNFSKLKKKPIFFVDNFFKKFSITNCYHSIFRVHQIDINYLSTKKDLKKVESYFDKKYIDRNVNINSFVKEEVFHLVYGKRKKLNLFNIKKNKKKTVIALNSFSDSPHYSGKLIFRDYFDWYQKTIQYINHLKDDDTHWLIKLHPAQTLEGKLGYNELNSVMSVINDHKQTNIKVLEDGINNQDLFKEANNLITAVSTIGLEYAAFGKKPILCGEGNYSSLGFSYNMTNKKKYYSILKNLPKDNRLSNKQIKDAKRAIYYLDNFINNKINIVSNNYPPRYHNKIALSSNEYLSLIIKNFKNQKKISLNEKYYTKLKNLVLNDFENVKNIKSFIGKNAKKI